MSRFSSSAGVRLMLLAFVAILTVAAPAQAYTSYMYWEPATAMGPHTASPAPYNGIPFIFVGTVVYKGAISMDPWTYFAEESGAYNPDYLYVCYDSTVAPAVLDESGHMVEPQVLGLDVYGWASTIPLPPSALLLGTGLMAMAVARCRKRWGK
jgi:hypothetical protein